MSREYRIRLLNRVYILPQGDTTIGRDPACHIHLEGDLVSRRHAMLSIGDEGAVIADAGSENGVFVNGVKLEEPIELKHDDQIRIAFFDMHFEEQEKASSTGRTVLMVFCTECGAVLAPEMRFCTQCGARMRRPARNTPCPACSATVTSDMRFCFRCGGKLPG